MVGKEMTEGWTVSIMNKKGMYQNMKKIFQRKKFTHIASLFAAIIAAIVLPLGVVNAWGPERETFTIEKPATFITFDSITNNPNYGDERNFLIAKDASNTGAGGWQDTINVQDGKEYILRLYVHNNAAANYNLVAKNTRVKVNVPNTMAKSHQLDGFITADNATPKKIWDSVVLKGDKDFTLTYVAGSAKYHNNVNPGTGFPLADSIVTSAGALVGYKSMNGDVPGCFEYSGIATLKVRATTKKDPNFTITKKVRKAGSTNWSDKITAKKGDKLEYRIGYDNTGQTVQNNVIIRDTLPKGITFTKNTTTLKNATNPSGNGKPVGSDALFSQTGINIGNYTPNSNAFIYYSATVSGEDLKCGVNNLKNTASASTDNGRKTDTAEVVVEQECKPNECKPGIPEGDPRCEETPGTTTPGDSDMETPSELPRTGPVEIVLTIMLVALAVLGGTYWYTKKHGGKKRAPKQFIAAEGSDLDLPEDEIETEIVVTDAPSDVNTESKLINDDEPKN